MVRPWHVGVVVFTIAMVMSYRQVADINPWFLLAYVPLFLFVVFTIVMEKVKGPGWENGFKTERQRFQEKHGMFGENSPYAPLRGKPIMWAVAAAGIIGGMVLLDIGNRTQAPYYWIVGILFFFTGAMGMGLASMPPVEAKPTQPTAQPTPTDRGTINPHGTSTYQYKTASKGKVAVISFLAISLSTGLMVAYEMGLFEASTTDLRGSSSTSYDHLISRGDDADSFALTGALSQSGVSKIFTIPEGATHWNVTISWTTFPTDSRGQTLIIEQNRDGTWHTVENAIVGGSFSERYESTGESWRFSLSAGASAGDRTVQAEVEYAQLMHTKCETLGNDEPNCTTSPV